MIDYALRAAKLRQQALRAASGYVPPPPAEPPPPKPPRRKKPDLGQVYFRVTHAVSNSFPDGDPIDHLLPYLERHGLTMKDVDRAVRRAHGLRRGGLYTWLAEMWEDTARDQIGDAEAHPGKVERHTAFYTIDKDGAVQPHSNPWKGGV